MRVIRQRRARGFSLIEIVVAVVILGVMSAVAVPSLRSMSNKNKLRSEVRQLVNLMKYARAEAIFNERTTAVYLDTKKYEYWLDLRTPDPKTGKYDPSKPKGQYEAKRKLDSKLFFESVTAASDDHVIDGSIIAVDFNADGTASPTIITVSNTADTKYTLEVLRSTGMVEYGSGDAEEHRARAEAAAKPLPTDNASYSGASL